MNESCPNPACGLLFASLDDVAVHISDPHFPCGAAQKALEKFGFDYADDANDEEDGSDCEGIGVLHLHSYLALTYTVTRY